MPAPRKQTTQARSPETANRLSIVKPAEVEPPKSPAPPDGLLPESIEAWDAVWLMPQAASFEGAHRVVVRRWVKAYDAWARALPVCESNPLVTGSTGQVVANPLMHWVASREAEMEKCERQLGVGLRNAADLGISVGQAKLTAAQLNAMTRGEPNGAGNEIETAPVVDAEGWEAV